ncbi:MAG TPA: hypothetical protein PKA28_13950 [Methylomusa anaerophila]|uniref:ParD-like antitoxin of type II bacterial toxin-antitoxin system n=1 Tax=Methylomusa anaerophila TaxID=1930071 RepID=A0A348AKC3_9FIRM|nr:hypothetical protein [Methylomusa anaerophila]BBB91521.1 hypothetical protein MAMMFC1_02205 [Methylomusa anaerophila]HML89541.1 hypothetical protein [Methylomusa anaerophila]
MATRSIRIDEELCKHAEKIGNAEHRSMPMQIEYWAKIGHLVLENPDLPVEFIQEILKAKSLRDEKEPFAFRDEN